MSTTIIHLQRPGAEDELAGTTFVTSPTRWAAQLTLASMFSATRRELSFLARGRPGIKEWVPGNLAQELGAAWHRALAGAPLIPDYHGVAPGTDLNELDDDGLPADFATVLRAVVLASDPRELRDLQGLADFASRGPGFCIRWRADPRFRSPLSGRPAC